VTNLSSMQETSVTFKFNYTSAAEDVDLNVVVDAENIVTEVSKKNNRYNENYQAIYTKFPDLNVEGVIIEDELLINNASTVKINISNIGYRKSTPADVYVYLCDDESNILISTLKLDELDINQSRILSTTWTPRQYGSYTINVVVNYSSDVTETNYDNNYYNHSVIVSNPNKQLLFIISDNSGVNSYNQATKSIRSEYAGLLDVQIRTNNQA